MIHDPRSSAGRMSWCPWPTQGVAACGWPLGEVSVIEAVKNSVEIPQYWGSGFWWIMIIGELDPQLCWIMILMDYDTYDWYWFRPVCSILDDLMGKTQVFVLNTHVPSIKQLHQLHPGFVNLFIEVTYSGYLGVMFSGCRTYWLLISEILIAKPCETTNFTMSGGWEWHGNGMAPASSIAHRGVVLAALSTAAGGSEHSGHQGVGRRRKWVCLGCWLGKVGGKHRKNVMNQHCCLLFFFWQNQYIYIYNIYNIYMIIQSCIWIFYRTIQWIVEWVIRGISYPFRLVD